MIKPAVLLTWPRHIDFPICRFNLERFKDYFSSIWIAFSEHHRGDDYTNFIRESLPFCHFVDVVRSREDWRDDAVNSLLERTTGEEYVMFYEQDFLIKDNTFFEKLFSGDHDFIYYKEGDRIHPAFSVVKRSLVNQTSKNFAVYPPGDHFYKFYSELPQGKNITDLGVVNKVDFYHLAGLSQNYINFFYGDPFYHPVNFIFYNFKNLQFPNQHPGFKAIQQQIENVYGHPDHHIFLNNFFPI